MMVWAPAFLPGGWRRAGLSGRIWDSIRQGGVELGPGRHDQAALGEISPSQLREEVELSLSAVTEVSRA